MMDNADQGNLWHRNPHHHPHQILAHVLVETSQHGRPYSRPCGWEQEALCEASFGGGQMVQPAWI